MGDYNHEERNVYLACGFTEREAKNLVEKYNEVMRQLQHTGANCLSRRIEAMEKNFTSKQIAFLDGILNIQNEILSDPKALLRLLMKD